MLYGNRVTVLPTQNLKRYFSDPLIKLTAWFLIYFSFSVKYVRDLESLRLLISFWDTMFIQNHWVCELRP
jgi:hypothetical protein